MIGKGLKKNNPTIALNILYTKEKIILPDYVSIHNSTREITIIKWMIPNKEKEGWHYLTVKKLSRLLKGIASKQHGGFYGLNCLYSFRTEN